MTGSRLASEISGYQVQWRKKSESLSDLKFKTVDATTTSYTITGLSHNTDYIVQVRTYNEAGSSPWSGELQATTATMPEEVLFLHHREHSYGYCNNAPPVME